MDAQGHYENHTVVVLLRHSETQIYSSHWDSVNIESYLTKFQEKYTESNSNFSALPY